MVVGAFALKCEGVTQKMRTHREDPRIDKPQRQLRDSRILLYYPEKDIRCYVSDSTLRLGRRRLLFNVVDRHCDSAQDF